MERMRLELEVEGHDVVFAAINSAKDEAKQQQLVERCAFPLFQDQEEVDARALLGGDKDDIYVYDSTGHLFAYLPMDGDVPTELATDEGYEGMKGTILAAP